MDEKLCELIFRYPPPPKKKLKKHNIIFSSLHNWIRNGNPYIKKANAFGPVVLLI